MTHEYSSASATRELFERYLAIIEAAEFDPHADDARLSLQNLAWMCREGAANVRLLPIDKTSRWLGFVQGCLCMRGLTDVDTERDVSRPLFHAAYQSTDGDLPPTFERRD